MSENVINFPKKPFSITFYVLKGNSLLLNEDREPFEFIWIRFGYNLEQVEADFICEAQFKDFIVTVLDVSEYTFVRDTVEGVMNCAFVG
jgi:hypothetical protein